MSCPYSVRSTRAIASLPDAETSRFVVGTQGLRDDNTVHVLDFDAEKNSVRATVYGHKSEVWHVAPSPTNAALLATCYSDATGCSRSTQPPRVLTPPVAAGKGHRASLWRFPANTAPRDGCARCACSPLALSS